MVKKTIDEILDAAEAVISRNGIASLTIDSAAAEAGLSKGGLLHHFSTKDKLVEALVQRAADYWRTCVQEAYEEEPEGPGRMARGIVSHCLTDSKEWNDETRSKSSAVFAALAQNPKLIGPMREVYHECHERLKNDGLPDGVGEAIVSAIDGMWLNWALGFATIDEAHVARMKSALEGFLRQAIESNQ